MKESHGPPAPEGEPNGLQLETRRDVLRLWARSFGIATLIGSAFAVQQIITMRTSGQPVRPLLAFASQLLPFYCWALFVPLIVAAILRFERLRGWRWVGAHLGLASLLTLVQVTLLTWPTRALGYFPELSLPGMWQRLLAVRGASELLYAGLIFAVIHAVLRARRARAEELRRSNLAREVLEARLASLRIQLEPHFLLNTLNGISALAGAGDREATEEAIAETGDLLREILRRPDIVPLRRELELLGLYLRIVRRSRSGAELDIRAAPGTLDCAVPSFLLQPLVENAFKHGHRGEDGVRRAELSAERSDGHLELVVRNPVEPKHRDPKQWLAGVGMANTRRRLETLYGTGATLDVASEGGWVAVRVRLPADLSMTVPLDS